MSKGPFHNKWVETYIHMFCNHKQNNWSDLLHMAEFAYNNHTHPSIGMSPFKANVGYDMTLTGEGPTWGKDTPLWLALLMKLHKSCQVWLEEAHRKQAIQYNQSHVDTLALKEGDLMWLDSTDLATDQPSPKLEALWFSPFKINKVMGPLTYQLDLPKEWKVNKTFHRSKLHPAKEPTLNGQTNQVTNPVTVTNKVPNNVEGDINPTPGQSQPKPNHNCTWQTTCQHAQPTHS